MGCQDEVYSADNLIELTPNLPAVPKTTWTITMPKVVVEVASQLHQLPTMVVAPPLLSNILRLLLLEPRHIRQHLPKTHHTHPHSSTTSHPRLRDRQIAMWREIQS